MRNAGNAVRSSSTSDPGPGRPSSAWNVTAVPCVEEPDVAGRHHRLADDVAELVDTGVRAAPVVGHRHRPLVPHRDDGVTRAPERLGLLVRVREHLEDQVASTAGS